MTTKNLKLKLAYLFLILFLVLVILLFSAVWPDIVYQRYLILLMTVFYFFWGIIVHLKLDQLTKKIVLEYLGVSLLAGLMVFLITL